jgi:hypothetical protein
MWIVTSVYQFQTKPLLRSRNRLPSPWARHRSAPAGFCRKPILSWKAFGGPSSPGWKFPVRCEHRPPLARFMPVVSWPSYGKTTWLMVSGGYPSCAQFLPESVRSETQVAKTRLLCHLAMIIMIRLEIPWKALVLHNDIDLRQIQYPNDMFFLGWHGN